MRRFLLATPLLIMTLVAITSGVKQLTSFRQASDEPAAWRAASDQVAKQLQGEDRVIIHPPWSRTALPHLRAVDHALLHRDPILLEDLQGVSTLWILTLKDREGDALDALPFDAKAEERKDFGSVSLLHVTVPESTQWGPSLSSMIETARITRHAGEQVMPCERFDSRARSWRCQGAGVNTFGVSERDISESWRTCTEASLSKQSPMVRFIYPDVATGKTLRLRAGWMLTSLRRRRHKPSSASWKVFAGEELLQERDFSFDDAWHLIELDTSRLANKTTSITIEVSSPDPHQVALCFDGWVLD